jgi:hypothetical protein
MRSDRNGIYFTREELDTLDSLAVGIDVDAINVRAEGKRWRPEARDEDIGCFRVWFKDGLNHRGIIDSISIFSKAKRKFTRALCD